MLHILMNSPFLCDFRCLLRIIKKKDELLLLSDGVFSGITNSFFFDNLMMLMVPIYALENDIIARGLSSYISDKISLVDYIDFVKLTEKHSLSLSW